MTTILNKLRHWADHAPTQTAIASSGGNVLSYADLMRAIGSLVDLIAASKLERVGAWQSLPVVATVFPSDLPAAVAFLGVSSCATAAPLNPNYTRADFDFYLSDLKPHAVLVRPQIDTPAREAACALGIPVIEFEIDYASLGRSLGEKPTTQVDPSPADIALMLYTSGTTSRPKRVPLTHVNLYASARNISTRLNLELSDRCLNMMPLFHIHGIAASLLATLVSGGSTILAPGFNADQFLGLLDEYRPTWYSAVPTIHQAVLALVQKNTDAIRDHSLRFIRSASSPLPPSVMCALEETFRVPVLEAYGMTEATHQITSNPLPPGKRKPGTVGIPTAVEVRLLHSDGVSVHADGHGEILLRGENVMRGYDASPQVNADAFVDGWFRTGDEGYIDEEGYLHLTGRIKEMINRGGEKIVPREIDEALLEHPAVEHALAFAIPHPTLGEDVGAAVTLRSGSTSTEAELRAYLFQHLAEFKIPTQIVIVDMIPQGATGKAQRIGLAEQLSDRLRPDRVPPETVAQDAVLLIWQEVLGLDEIGILDNFFALGGDSLSATRFISRVNAQFQLRMSLRSVFETPRLIDFAQRIEEEILKEIEGHEASGSDDRS